MVKDDENMRCHISPGGGGGVVMRISTLLVFPFLWSLTLYQHTVPYLSFMGQTLANHSYVDISQVRNDSSGNDSVQCHSDLSTCCRGAYGSHRGDWYFPNGDTLPFPESYNPPPIFESHQAQRVGLRHNSGTEKTGIYRCDIETAAVHDNGMRETVYVGLYTSDRGRRQSVYRKEKSISPVTILPGEVTISGDMELTVNSDLNGDSPQFTLTCISTGGPAITVTWTRDSTTTVTEGTETVLDDPETAQYTHTLTVTGRIGGLYNCTVSKNKPSITSASITLEGIFNHYY